MNMDQIREQLEGINLQSNISARTVLHEITVRKDKRKKKKQLIAVVALLAVILCAVQFQQISAFAESLYRELVVALRKDTLVFENFEFIPVEIRNLNWISSGEHGKRIGEKRYDSIETAEDELKISILRNPNSIELNRYMLINLIYFESDSRVELIFPRHFIGDLKDYQETKLENGDLYYSYQADDQTTYKSPLTMKIIFFAAAGDSFTNHSWTFFDYEEMYQSPASNITAYLMKDAGRVAFSGQELKLYDAATETKRIAAFAQNNLLYVIEGNTSVNEMRHLVDTFVISE